MRLQAVASVASSGKFYRLLPDKDNTAKIQGFSRCIQTLKPVLPMGPLVVTINLSVLMKLFPMYTLVPFI